MLGAVAGLASREGVEVVGMEAAAVSYPAFSRPGTSPAGRWLGSAERLGCAAARQRMPHVLGPQAARASR